MPRLVGTRVVICPCGRRSNGRIGAQVICVGCGRQTTLGPPSKKVRWTSADKVRAASAVESRKEKLRDESAVWRETHREQLRQSNWVQRLRRVHGMTEQQYLDLLAQQNGLCAICKKPPLPGTRLYVDHNHHTKQRRGLLCRHCNLTLGHAFDSVEILMLATAYLEAHGQRPLPGSR